MEVADPRLDRRAPVRKEGSTLRRGFVVLAVLLTGATCSGVGPYGGISPGEISIDPDQVTLGAIGARRQLGVVDGEGIPIPSGNGVSWASSDQAVASVDGSGIVSASGDGQATITATLAGQEAAALVTVAATIETTVEVTATDQSDSDDSDNQVVTTITVVAP
ncbi:MAG: Ig-like domain-containing protein [Gemmatimonadota bacterium]